jgi:iron complex transport system permease protein
MTKRLIYLFLVIAFAVSGICLSLFWGAADGNIIWQIRLPRLLLCLFTGMSLAGIGSIYQLMLVNPLAEPYILGISSGSAFGAILFGVLGLSLLMPLGGFIGAGLTLLLVWQLAQKKGSFDRSRLLISGVIAGMFFSAGISLLMYLFQKDTLVILGTLMGNLGHIFTRGEWNLFLGLTAVSAAILVRLYYYSPALDIMSGGDVYAGSVGINVTRIRKEIFILTSVLIGVTVSYAGIIGFIGLIIPHIVRFFVSQGQKKVYLLSLVSGGVFLIWCDLAARSVTTIELPVGVVTAAIGCPFFIWLLRKK